MSNIVEFTIKFDLKLENELKNNLQKYFGNWMNYFYNNTISYDSTFSTNLTNQMRDPGLLNLYNVFINFIIFLFI